MEDQDDIGLLGGDNEARRREIKSEAFIAAGLLNGERDTSVWLTVPGISSGCLRFLR